MRVKGLLLFLLAWAACGQTPFEFRPLQRLTDGETILRLSAPANQNFRIDASTNAVQWDGLLTLRSVGVNSHRDTATPFLPSRFYRAEQVATNALTGDHLATTNGEVVIHPLYHASVLLAWNGKAIYNDPDDDANYENRYIGMPKADLILVSHTHSDHFSAAKLHALRTNSTIIIAPQAVYNSTSMDATLRSLTIVLSNGRSTNVLGLNVESVPAYNTNNNNHLPGVGNGYVVTIGDKRLYFSGDTSNTPEMRALPEIDVAFLCMNLPFTMSANDAVNAVNGFRPKIVYPYHYREGQTTTTNAAYFKSRVPPSSGIEVRLRGWY